MQEAMSRAGQVPRKYKKMHAKVMSGKASRSLAMKVMCLECMGWEIKEVRLCRSRACPLWNHRLRDCKQGDETPLALGSSS
jgi:hypothetical protein